VYKGTHNRCVKNWLKIPNRLGKMSENRRRDFLTHTVGAVLAFLTIKTRGLYCSYTVFLSVLCFLTETETETEIACRPVGSVTVMCGRWPLTETVNSWSWTSTGSSKTNSSSSSSETLKLRSTAWRFTFLAFTATRTKFRIWQTTTISKKVWACVPNIEWGSLLRFLVKLLCGMYYDDMWCAYVKNMREIFAIRLQLSDTERKSNSFLPEGVGMDRLKTNLIRPVRKCHIACNANQTSIETQRNQWKTLSGSCESDKVIIETYCVSVLYLCTVTVS